MIAPQGNLFSMAPAKTQLCVAATKSVKVFHWASGVKVRDTSEELRTSSWLFGVDEDDNDEKRTKSAGVVPMASSASRQIVRQLVQLHFRLERTSTINNPTSSPSAVHVEKSVLSSPPPLLPPHGNETPHSTTKIGKTKCVCVLTVYTLSPLLVI